MTCQELTDFVEPIAAGDLEPDAEMRAHFETCPLCASELASARRIETAVSFIDTSRPIYSSMAVLHSMLGPGVQS